MSRLLALAFVCVVLAGAAGAPVSVAGTESTATGQEQSPVFTTPDGFETTTFIVTVYENGSARWTFNYYTGPLNESDNEIQQFRAFAEEFQSQETELWTNFNRRAAALVAAGTTSTGRNMTASGFQRSASVESVGTRGQVTMSFLWGGFARTADGRVIVGDVFEDEFYIAPNQWLVFEAGPNLTFVAEEIQPAPDEYSGQSVAESDTITWFGEQQFPDNRPRVVLASGAASGAVTTTVMQAGTESTLPVVVIAVVVIVVGLLAGVAWRTGKLGQFGSRTTQTDETTTTESSTGDGTTDTEADSGPTVTDEQLLSDEDRVLNMLETNGGRMKQANIVEETGWSKSKVSMLLSDMEEDELISKLRVGRENIISLRGHEPEAAGSPFDDED